MQLIAGSLFASLGMVVIFTRHAGSFTIREMQASGPAAQFIGILFLIMGIMMLIDWVKKYKQHHR
jgi:putative Ca2+/H+ antiporter (TMEM165/GDT1 family)